MSQISLEDLKRIIDNLEKFRVRQPLPKPKPVSRFHHCRPRRPSPQQQHVRYETGCFRSLSASGLYGIGPDTDYARSFGYRGVHWGLE